MDIGNLVLSRKPGQSINLQAPTGLPITIEVLAIDRNKVYLKFSAAKDVAIFRSELLTEDAA